MLLHPLAASGYTRCIYKIPAHQPNYLLNEVCIQNAYVYNVHTSSYVVLELCTMHTRWNDTFGPTNAVYQSLTLFTHEVSYHARASRKIDGESTAGLFCIMSCVLYVCACLCLTPTLIVRKGAAGLAAAKRFPPGAWPRRWCSTCPKESSSGGSASGRAWW